VVVDAAWIDELRRTMPSFLPQAARFTKEYGLSAYDVTSHPDISMADYFEECAPPEGAQGHRKWIMTSCCASWREGVRHEA
jgi:Asp-tRNA(Asn)/Glu-tRNA(Gln) amidotransferase B subunit